MSFLGRLLPSLTSNIQKPVLSTVSSATSTLIPGGLYNIATRNIIRCHFPRPSERKRIKRHGWKHRMSTEAGRRIIMRMMLKGKFIYSH